MSNPIVSGSDYLALPRAPQTWLVEDVLPVGGSLLVYGDPKVGKSYAALQMACCLSTGSEWLGFHVPVAVPVVYIQLDTPRTLWADRVEKLGSAGHPIELVYQADRETLDTFPFDILNPEHFAKLTVALKQLTIKADSGDPVAVEPGVVIIDTIREAHSGDENDSTEMQEVIAHLDAAVKPAALVLVAHSRKSNPEVGYDLMNDNRGSNYIVGRMDAICRFSRESMRLTSRTMEEHSVKLERRDDGTWDLSKDETHLKALALLKSFPDTPIRELARSLHDATDKSESACRAILRRAKENLDRKLAHPADDAKPKLVKDLK